MLVGGIVAVGFHPRADQFLIEVEQEMGRVTWPATNEVWRFTIVIAIMTTLLAALVFVVDLVNKTALDYIIGIGG
jgi:preprotein translocase SecE subunit